MRRLPTGGTDTKAPTEYMPPVAMPMHMALDSDTFIVDIPSGKLFAKVYLPECPAPIDFAAAAVAYARAGERGLGAPLRASYPDLGVLLCDLLLPPLRMAMRPDLDRIALRSNLFTSLCDWHRGAPLASERDIFADWRFLRSSAEALVASGRSAEMVLGPYWASMCDDAQTLASAIASAGQALTPVHGEVMLSNMMIDAADKVTLVDFDRAGNGDPYLDVAAACLEFWTCDEDVAFAVEAYQGHADAKLIARTRLYMVMNDLVWGLWLRLAHFRSPKSGVVEFYKLGEVRLMRARALLAETPADLLARTV
jgi:hypothetical protein